MKLLSQLFLVIFASLFATACVNSQYDESKKDLVEEEQENLDLFRAELEIGRNMAGRLLQYYGTVDDERLIQYINRVGLYVSRFSDKPKRKYMFHILDSDIANAFACPGGYILVTKGAIKAAKSEAELAMILSHEVAHVARQHMFDKLRNMSEEELEANAASIEQKRLDSVGLEMRERVEPEESKAGEALAKYLSGGAAGINFVKAAGAGMGVMLEKGLDAKLEYEADTLGVQYATLAGYYPPALAEYLCRLKRPNGQCADLKTAGRKTAKNDKKTILDKTHPPIGERLNNIDKVLAELEAGKMVGAQGSKRFKKFTTRL